MVVAMAAFAEGIYSGAGLGDALIAGVSAAALTYVGGQQFGNGLDIGFNAPTFAAVAKVGTVGGAASMLQGGKFGHGFVSAGLGPVGGKAVGGALGGIIGNESVRRVVSSSIVGGTLSSMTGDKFANGAKATAFLLAMRGLPAVYKKITGYELDMGPGGAAVGKKPLDMPVEGANNIGIQETIVNPNCMACEGGRVSEVLNVVPGVNAVAGVHDVMQVSLGTGIARDVLNVPGMIPAAAFTYIAALGQPLTHLNAGQIIGVATTYSRNKERDCDDQLPYVVGY